MDQRLSTSGNALSAIGNTPVVQLRNVVPYDCANVYLKLENLNPTGSYKDRMAMSIVEEAERRGDLLPGMQLVEATGGSTGSSLAFVCAVKGYAFHVVSSNAFAIEKLRTMSAFGAKLDIINSPSKQITADLIPSMVKRAQEVAKTGNAYFTNQFRNPDVLAGYRSMGDELVTQFPGGINAFCAAVGGAGMAMGVASVLKEKIPNVRVIVLEPSTAPMITEGKTGIHSVEGIGIGFYPPLLDQRLFDEARSVQEDKAREMCRRLAREEGLLVGTSTGVNVVAAIELAKELGKGKTVVTVACDTGLKYMNSALFAE